MKRYIITSILLFFSFVNVAQEKELEQDHILNAQN